jgi:hypothetical protein
MQRSFSVTDAWSFKKQGFVLIHSCSIMLCVRQLSVFPHDATAVGCQLTTALADRWLVPVCEPTKN